jgi:hypothetical protein
MIQWKKAFVGAALEPNILLQSATYVAENCLELASDGLIIASIQLLRFVMG